jgi:hypothetical protein
MSETCDNCGSFEFERFSWFALEFDVAAANKLVVPERETRVVPEAFLRGMGLQLELPKCLNCSALVPECKCGNLSYNMTMGTGINDKHLAHLNDLDRPGVIAVILYKKPMGESKYMSILIDGNHRAVRAHREGREFKAIVLTPQESWKIMTDHLGSLAQNPNTKKGKEILKALGWDKK